MKPLPILVALGVLVTSGVVHGLWTERWQKSQALEAAAARVELVPLEVGDWRGQALPADAKEFAQAGAESYWVRQYAHKNRLLTVILMCGRAGRMSVHTPEVCYQGVGFQMMDAPDLFPVALGQDAEKAEFWTARFVKQLGVASNLRLFWSWNADGAWKAPANPRWEFRGDPYLFKLYVVHETSPNQRLEDEPSLEFFRQFLPLVEQTLFSP